ncbi:hypothetical protein TTHERM_00458170 (macronuclear) [Tetrahymena thermophila SB210]|uniref:Uncharacterized protein n=1 Tax=Tetrahymena thermophila (strain SB210) TaxID=312017 RepID=I7MM52_TETTS|nr:hypothetical protein TTHERM_00458170 [Tetrahymena thermophila SB210]EAS03979.2 hypothetical protein TTHERM_00458170 [Tetrahymena thermophila SB210]|eukprot:XP_001024224.2 hypothetical protein TTHERM_00458170 [Tetrahymena thermophila SB210]
MAQNQNSDSFEQESDFEDFIKTNKNFQSYLSDLPASKNMTQSHSLEKQIPNNRFIRGNKVVVVSNGYRRERDLQKFQIHKQNDQYLQEKGISELETQTSSVNITPKQQINKIAQKIFRKGFQTFLQPKEIPFSINQSQQQQNLYYVGGLNNFVQSPRQFQAIQSESKAQQQLQQQKQILQNNNSKMKIKDKQNLQSQDQLCNISHFKIIKREQSHPDLAIISRKNSRMYFEKDFNSLQQQTESSEQYNQFLTKSQCDVSNQLNQQPLTSSSLLSLQNLSNIQTPVFKMNVNPVTQQIEIQGQKYLKKGQSKENKLIQNENLVMKNEILASKLSSLQNLKDKTNINKINIVKIIQKQNKQLQKRNQLQKQQQIQDQNKVNILQEKEQEENSKKYFEIIQKQFLDIETFQNDQNTQTSLNEEIRLNDCEQENEIPNFLSLNSLKSNICNQQDKVNSLKFLSKNEISSQLIKTSNEDQLSSFNQIPHSLNQISETCNQYIDQSLNSLQMSYLQKRTSFNESSQQSQTPRTRSSFDHIRQIKKQSDNRPSEKFTLMLQISKQNVQQNIHQKFDLYKNKQKNLLLEKYNFDTYRFKQIQTKIKQTQSRLYNNNLI